MLKARIRHSICLKLILFLSIILLTFFAVKRKSKSTIVKEAWFYADGLLLPPALPWTNVTGRRVTLIDEIESQLVDQDKRNLVLTDSEFVVSSFNYGYLLDEIPIVSKTEMMTKLKVLFKFSTFSYLRIKHHGSIQK